MNKVLIFGLVASLAASNVIAGKNVKICRDEKGNPYFTDVSCQNQKAAEDVVYVPKAQGYSREFSAGEVEMLINHERRKNRIQEPARDTPSVSTPSYEDRIAASNALQSARNERNMYRHRKNGPRDAAELAIEYNAASTAGGGSHQVRVPDVTNIRIHTDRSEEHHHYGR